MSIDDVGLKSLVEEVVKQVVSSMTAMNQACAEELADDLSSPSGGTWPGEYLPQSPSGAFAYDDGEIMPGGIVCRSRFIRVDGMVMTEEKFSGYVYLEIPIDGSSISTPTVGKGSSIPESNGTLWVVPLYKFENGSVTEDYRGAPVVPWLFTGNDSRVMFDITTDLNKIDVYYK